ncbi:MAG: hypothetical protein RLY86_1751 [Pseudomonadota bacterium]|jgi:putative photosynthetic complex assembly protein
MTAPTADSILPRGALIGAAAVIALSILAALAGRVGGPVELVEQAPVVQSRLLNFQDGDDGSIAVTDAASGALLARLAVGEGGFIRGSMRGLARDRGRRGIGAEVPFRLEKLADGKMILTDPALDRTIDLAAFGHTNMTAYARLLDSRGETP